MFKTRRIERHRGSFIFCLLTQLGVMYRRHLTDKEGERKRIEITL